MAGDPLAKSLVVLLDQSDEVVVHVRLFEAAEPWLQKIGFDRLAAADRLERLAEEGRTLHAELGSAKDVLAARWVDAKALAERTLAWKRELRERADLAARLRGADAKAARKRLRAHMKLRMARFAGALEEAERVVPVLRDVAPALGPQLEPTAVADAEALLRELQRTDTDLSGLAVQVERLAERAEALRDAVTAELRSLVDAWNLAHGMSGGAFPVLSLGIARAA